jgi:predicted transcriptional regulator
MPEQQQQLITDVEILKRDVSNINSVLEKLDTAIDRIADVANGINQILAVHEAKQEATSKDIEILHQRITDGENELKDDFKNYHLQIKELFDRMDSRISTLERWKWYIMGTAWGLGFLIATMLQAGNLISFFN